MSFAHITAGVVDQERDRPPTEGTRQDTGQTVSGIQPSDLTLLAACGWRPVVNTARPADTDTDTSTRSIVVTAGVPTETWTVRLWTAAELTANTAAANKSAIETNLAQDLAAMQAIIDTPNASFTTIGQAQTAVRDVQRQLKDVARNLRRLDRHVLGQFDGTT